MRYASVCSGIEAATVAWHPLGWEPAWFSQFDPEWDYIKNGLDFPSRILQKHFPEVPNLGDMTKLQQNKIYNYGSFQLLVGGTPCQSFSVAGFRKGLADQRGNLALEYVRILDEKRPKWFVWENVPGVLSSGGKAETYQQTATSSEDFACILSAFTGLDISPAQTIPKAGIISGSFYSIAWRIFDSQYFGVPQRRRRIFVIGHLGTDWRPSAAVLFEPYCLRGDITPKRKERQETTRNIEGSTTDASDKGYRMTAFGAYVDDGTSSTMKKRDFKDATDLVVTGFRNAGFADYQQTNEAGTIKKSGGDLGGGSETLVIVNDQGGSSINIEKGEVSPTLRAQTHQHEPVIAYGIQANIIGRKDENGGNGKGFKEEQAPTLTKLDRHAVCAPLILKMRGGKDGGGKGYLGDTEKAFTLTTLQDQHLLAPMAFAQNQLGDIITGKVMHTLNTNSNATGRNSPNVLAPVTFGDVHDALTKTANQTTGVTTYFCCNPNTMVVRRLTPKECERLQGFPDDYTLLEGWSDSYRYAALGNSMTTNVMAWIGRRIDIVNKILNNE